MVSPRYKKSVLKGKKEQKNTKDPLKHLVQKVQGQTKIRPRSDVKSRREEIRWVKRKMKVNDTG